MKISSLIFIVTLAIKLCSTSYCSKQLQYHEEYGYGTDIRCENLTSTDKNLYHLGSFNPTYLQIKNSELPEASPKLFENVKNLKILEIVNSTFYFNKTQDIFKALRRLEQLKIQNSRFGRISERTFKSLEFLEELYLNGISINSLPKNSLSALRSLQTLDLSQNLFGSIVNIPFCEVPHLKRIILRENDIQTLESSSFICNNNNEDTIGFDLNALKYKVTLLEPVYMNANPKSHLIELRLDNNKITTISYSLEDLDKLKTLYLAHNKINALHGYEFATLYNLQKIDLQDNLLVNISEVVFMKNKALKQINLSNNRLKYVIFKNIPSLNYIDLGFNNIDLSNIGKWENLPELLILDLSHNNIKAIPKNIFKNIANLTTIDLSDNNIALENDTFELLPNLTNLNLRSNGLKVLPSDMFVKLVKLQYLDLSNNDLIQLNYNSVFKQQINLVHLNLSYNKFEHVNREIFDPLKNLKLLDIEGNKLKFIDVNIISNLHYLHTINIRNNKFSCQFLTDLLKYLKEKDIVYTSQGALNITGENVGGVPCTESLKPVIKPVVNPVVKPVVVENITKLAEPDKPKFLQNHGKPKSKSLTEVPESSSASTISGVTVSLLLILCFAGYACYRYYKRKRFVTDHFELIGE